MQRGSSKMASRPPVSACSRFAFDQCAVGQAVEHLQHQINTASYGGRPPFAQSEGDSAPSSSARNPQMRVTSIAQGYQSQSHKATGFSRGPNASPSYLLTLLHPTAAVLNTGCKARGTTRIHRRSPYACYMEGTRQDRLLCLFLRI